MRQPKSEFSETRFYMDAHNIKEYLVKKCNFLMKCETISAEILLLDTIGSIKD